jgi:uncharacterized repeat protein (TIGR01451 family)
MNRLLSSTGLSGVRMGALLWGVLLLVAALGTAPVASAQSQIGVTISFRPAVITAGQSSTLTIAFRNTGNTAAVVQNPFVDHLPPGMTTVGAGAPATCAGGSAAARSASISFTEGGTIPAGGCSFIVAVTATASSSYYTNTIGAGAIQTSLGTNAAASATLTVQTSNPVSSVPTLTKEQASVASALQSTCTALANASATGTVLGTKQQDLLGKCTSIIGDYQTTGNAAQLAAALTAISGRQATATARLPMQFAAGQEATLSDRLDEVRAGARGISVAGLDLGDGGALSQLGPLQDMLKSWLGRTLGGAAGDEEGGLLGNRLGIFLTGTLRDGTLTPTDAEAGFNVRDTGLTVGVDYRLGSSYILGISGGFGRTTAGFDDNGGRLDSKNVSGQLYGSYFTDHFHLDWVAGFGHEGYNLTRQIDYASSSTGTGCDGTVCDLLTTGETSAHTFNSSLAAGGDFHEDALAFGPTLEVEYKQVRVNGFDESGDSGLDLNYGSITMSSLVSKVGGYVSYAWNTRWFVVLPQLRARYLHEFQNDQRTQTVQFGADTLPGAADRTFLIYTDPADRNYFDWRASVLIQFPFGIAGFVDYGGIAGLKDMSMHEFNIGLRVER